jgi:hypothetical protein
MDVNVTVDSSAFVFTETLSCDFSIGTGSLFFLTFNQPGQGRVILNGTDTSGVIIVQEPNTDYIQIRTAPYGRGSRVISLIMTSDDSFTFFAARYDFSDNFIQNQIVEWSTTGTLDSVSTIDTALVFPPINDPCLPSVSGTIVAKTENLSYETGIIAVVRCGGICYIKIRSAPYGVGDEITDVSMTTDDSLTLCAAAYDGEDNYIYDCTAEWTLTGSLEGVDVDSTHVFRFKPTIAPATGTIIARVNNIIDTTGIITVEKPTSISENHTPLKYELRQACPNPFNPSTTIKFSLPKPEHVILEVYNNIGQKIETVINRKMNAGEHRLEFNAENLSSGIYLYRIEAGEYNKVMKMILIK